MPTIAYISSILPKQSETFVYREIRELRRRGWDVVCVSLNPAEPVAGLEDVARGSVTVYDGWGRMLADKVREDLSHPIRAAGTQLRMIGDALAPGEPTSPASRLKLNAQAFAGTVLARRLRKRGVRHIHCHFAHAPTTVGMYAARQLGVPFSFTGHANDIFQRRALLKRKLQRAAFVSCISDWHRDFYTRIESTCAPKCHVVRCGVDVESWKFDAQQRGSAWNRCFRLLTVCRLVEKKGVDTLLRGLGRFAAATDVDFELTVAGDGPQREELESIARREHVLKHVKFLGAVDNDRVRTLLTESDAFALPCRDDASGDRDGIPVVLMEAMACGLPVISGDLPAIRELVDHGKSGLMVDGTDAQAGAAAIALLARDVPARKRLGEAGRARVVQEFSLAGNVDRIEGLLKGSISGGGGVAPINPVSEPLAVGVGSGPEEPA